ncbi:hypothetical protein [Yinghuangia seranimata]|uniref:hypothetical protein n=1 Tax=Yinghuangia seranimata TaxID=408067 RepID=UPI00248C55E1|nr:hypothetical protein [Yinghuangia seranimata]MDI2127604.1 hypothetical protein [Yinghuangia seranimata]
MKHIPVDVLDALARSTEPAAVVAGYAHPDASTALRRRILAGGPGTPPVPAELRELLYATSAVPLLAPALHGQDRDLAAHAAAVVDSTGPNSAPREPADVYTWLRSGRRTPDEEADGQDEEKAVQDLLDSVAFGLWTAGEWNDFAARYAAQPIASMMTWRLLTHPDCPPAAAVTLMLACDDGTSALLHGLVTGRLTPEYLATEASGAAGLVSVLCAAAVRARAYSEPTVPAAVDAVRAAVRAELGADPERWRALLALLRTGYSGSLPELLRATADPAPARLPAAPKRRDPEADTHPGDARTGSSWTWLLTLAEPAHQGRVVRALTARLSDADRQEILAEICLCGDPRMLSDDLVEAFLASADARHRARFAALRWHRPQTLARLAALDDTAVNSVLLNKPGIPAAMKGRIAHSGWFTLPGTDADDPVVRQYGGAALPKALIHAPDAHLVYGVLGTSAHSLCATYQVAGCRRLIALGRLDLAADFVLGEPAANTARPHNIVVTTLREPLGAGDAAAAEDAARALVESLFATHLLTPTGSELTCHFEVDLDPDWPRIARLLAGRPVPQHAAATLAALPGAPDHLARAILEADPAQTARHIAVLSPELASAALDLVSLEGARGTDWIRDCIEQGLLTAEDVATRAWPAGALLGLCFRQPDTFANLSGHVRDLIARHSPLAGETTAILAQLAPEFTGTLPELLATASAAAEPVR